MFAKKIGALVRTYQNRIDDVMISARREISHRTWIRTPVDSGDARRNWKGEGLYSETYTYFNDLKTIPYIRRLEYGWSPQAPNGMVRISAAEWPEIVKSMVDKYAS